MALNPWVLAATGAVLVSLGSVAGVWTFRHRGEAPSPLRAGGVPVVVELFSSEGCSSCPPADEYVATLDAKQPIDGVSVIALELHVDDWDRRGWKDPFSAASFSARQRDYARVLADRRTYTPEIVIDGNRQMPGGDEDIARTMMIEAARAPRARVVLERAGDRLAITMTDLPAASQGDTIEAWLAITESHLDSSPNAGENNGRVLVHAPIVRALRKVAVIAGADLRAEAALDLESSWRPKALRFVVFAQEVQSRRMLGAGALASAD